MGYALFTARKMSLQAKINDYSLKLSQISNEQDKLTQQIAAKQQQTNTLTSIGNSLGSIGSVGGAIVGGILGGIPGASALSGLGGGLGSIAGKGISNGATASQNMQQAQLSAKEKQLDTEKQRIDTLLKKAQQELTSVEQSEEKAIGSATPKYLA